MNKNIYLFTGEEKYLLDKELRRWKDGFVSKFGENSLFVYNSENFDSDKVLESIFAGGLFTSNKMVVVHGIPVDTDSQNKMKVSLYQKFVDEFLAREMKIPEGILLIFVSYKPDKRTKFYKDLSKNVDIKQFKLLNGVQLNLFVKEKFGNLRIDDEVLEYFLVKVGKDLYRLDREIDKIKTRCGFHNLGQIDNELLDKVVFGQVEINSFLFFDYLLTDRKKSLKIWEKIQEEGNDYNQIIGMLFWGLKLYIFILDLYEQGIKSSKIIAKTLKYHPFAVSKNLKNIDKIIEKEGMIKTFYSNLIDIDYKIKTGKLDASNFWLLIKKMLIEF